MLATTPHRVCCVLTTTRLLPYYTSSAVQSHIEKRKQLQERMETEKESKHKEETYREQQRRMQEEKLKMKQEAEKRRYALHRVHEELGALCVPRAYWLLAFDLGFDVSMRVVVWRASGLGEHSL
mgnify:CR=1 FL=1